MTPATIPVAHSLAGGALVGAGVALLRVGSGQIAGISGILGGVLRADPGRQGWRLFFLAGLLLPALIAPITGIDWPSGTLELGVAGLLVGFGTRLGSGCTSGHGVCGLANLSMRSAVATATFFGIAVLTVFVRHRLGY